MKIRSSLTSAAAVLLGVAVLAEVAPAQLWWERGADQWYYKDDWKAMAITGARQRVTRTIEVRGGAAGAWIVIWGDRGYRLLVNGKEIAASVDGGLIDDYDLSEAVTGAETVVLRIDGTDVCAEGEIVGQDGKRSAFATGEDWQSDGGGTVRAKKMEVQQSTGAFNRAHNGRLMAYNDEDAGFTRQKAVGFTWSRGGLRAA